MNSILRRAVPTALLAGGVLLAGGGVAAAQVPVGGAEGLGLDELADIGDLGIRDLGGAGDLGVLRDLESGNIGGLDDLGLGGGNTSSGVGLGSGGRGAGGGTLDSLCDGPLSVVGSVGGDLCEQASESAAVTGLSAEGSAPSLGYDGKSKPSFDVPSKAKKTAKVGTPPPHALPRPLGVVCTEPYTTVKNVRSFCDVHTAVLRDLADKGHDKMVPDHGFDKDGKRDKHGKVVPDDKKKSPPSS